MKKNIDTRVNKLTSIVNADNELEETKFLECDLKRLNEDYLADQAAIKTTASIND